MHCIYIKNGSHFQCHLCYKLNKVCLSLLVPSGKSGCGMEKKLSSGFNVCNCDLNAKLATKLCRLRTIFSHDTRI